MKQYDRFGEYMFDLLFAPLKKGKRAVNQVVSSTNDDGFIRTRIYF